MAWWLVALAIGAGAVVFFPRTPGTVVNLLFNIGELIAGWYLGFVVSAVVVGLGLVIALQLPYTWAMCLVLPLAYIEAALIFLLLVIHASGAQLERDGRAMATLRGWAYEEYQEREIENSRRASQRLSLWARLLIVGLCLFATSRYWWPFVDESAVGNIWKYSSERTRALKYQAQVEAEPLFRLSNIERAKSSSMLEGIDKQGKVIPGGRVDKLYRALGRSWDKGIAKIDGKALVPGKD